MASYDQDHIMEMEPRLDQLMKIFASSATHYQKIGIGLQVDVSDLLPIPTMSDTNLRFVFQRWIASGRDVTWRRIAIVCENFSDELGKANADLTKFLSSLDDSHKQHLNAPAKQKVINEDHPLVKELLESGYHLKYCLMAAEKCSNFSEAIDFLETVETLPLSDANVMGDDAKEAKIETLITPGTMKKWCEEGSIELTLTRVHMVGPPGSGKTCTQCLLLNEPPPKHDPAPSSDSNTSSGLTPTPPSDPSPSSSSTSSITNSTPIACKAVKALRVSIDDDEVWKAVNRDELVERLASDLKHRKDELDRKVSQKEAGQNSESRTSVVSEESSQVSENYDFEGAEQNDSEDVAQHYESGGILDKIVDLIPEAKAQLSDKWVHIVDSGGQPAYQELLPLFTRAASLNIVTIDLSKDLDEKVEFTYRINGKEFKCDEKMKYSNRKLFKSVVSCAGVQKPLQLKYVVKPPKHSMYFVLGTHYDKLVEKYKDNAESKLAEMNEDLMSLLTPHLKEFVVSKEIGKSIIFPHNTLLPAKSKEREQASKSLFKAISRRAEVSLTVRVPIRCFTFELYLESKAETKGFLTRDEAVQEGKKLYMSESEVNEALVYLHNCTIILYYPEIKPQLVFVDPQKILDVLSHLLALTYVDEESAQSLAKGIEEGEKINLKSKGRFQEALLEKFTAVFTDEFKPGYFINLLQHLHIIANYGPDTYFLPSALPSYDDSFNITSTEIKPLHYVWQMENEDDCDSEFSVPVPRGIFSLIIVHLLNQKKHKIRLPPSDNQYRNAFSLLVSIVGRRTHLLYIINHHTHIEVHFIDHAAKKHCPKIRDLVTKAIDDSSEDISVECNHVNAFSCPKKRGCHCIVEEDEEEGMIVNCSSHYPSVDISRSDDSYWCWFADKMSSSPSSQNPKHKTKESHKSLDPDILKKEPKNVDLLKIFDGCEHQYRMIGDSLEVKVTGIKYDAEAPKDSLRLVFERWREKAKDVTWKRIMQVCEDFSDEFGRVKSDLEEYLSSEKAREKYLGK